MKWDHGNAKGWGEVGEGGREWGRVGVGGRWGEVREVGRWGRAPDLEHSECSVYGLACLRCVSSLTEQITERVWMTLAGWGRDGDVCFQLDVDKNTHKRKPPLVNDNDLQGK